MSEPLSPALHPVVVAHLPTRQPWRAHWPHVPAAPRPGVDELADLVGEIGGSGRAETVWLGGGEPTLRADLPQLLRACASRVPELGLVTDGLVLASGGALEQLRSAGLKRLRIYFHSARPEVHDWLVGQRGAARRARKALQLAVRAGLPTEAEVVLSRPGSRWLPATVHMLAGLGVRTVHLRRPLRRSPDDADFIAASPRLGLLQEHLDRALADARDLGVQLHLHGLPQCAAPRAEPAQVRDGEKLHWPAILAELPAVRAWGSAPAAVPCSACPGPPHCGGAPADYVDRFGDLELQSERPGPLRRPQPQAPVFGQTPPEPAPRRGRSPATRPHVAGRLAAWPDIGGDPLAGQPLGEPPGEVHLRLDGPTRALRRALVRLAQHGPQRVVLIAPSPAPTNAELVREALRLGFAALELWAGPGALDDIRPRQLARLKGLQQVLLGTADPRSAAELSARIATMTARTEASVSALAWLDDAPTPAAREAWRAFWAEQSLGPPRFLVTSAAVRAAVQAWAQRVPGPVGDALREPILLPSTPSQLPRR